MQNSFKPLVLSLFLMAGVAFIGCTPTEETPTPPGNSDPAPAGEGETSSTDTPAEGMTLVSLKVPNMV